MEQRRILNEKILNFYAERARREFPDDVALLLCYGSCVNGTMNRLSDVDCFFVPATERGGEFAATYMLDGVGYDLFPMSWERLENIADLKESLCPLVGDAVVVYAKDGEALARFLALRERQKLRLADRDYLAGAVRGRMEFAAELFARCEAAKGLKDVRIFAGYLMMTLAEALLFHHGTYSHYGLKQQYEDLLRTPGIPREIPGLFRRVTETQTPSEVRLAIRGLRLAVCDHVGVPPECVRAEEESSRQVRPDPAYLASLYEEISSTFNKLEICAETGNAVLAFLTGACLQHELDEAREFGGPALNLLDKFNARDLDAFLRAARRVEKKFVTRIREMGGEIKRFLSFDEFLAHYGRA